MLNLIKKIYSKLTLLSNIEEKFYIDVPYSEKNKAKELGAKWDPAKKSWFIPKGFEQIHFEKWIKKAPDNIIEGNIRSIGFFIVESLRLCWKCKQTTPVFAFLLPENHQTKEYEDEDDEENDRIIWKTENHKSMVSYINFLNKKSLEIIHRFSSCYYVDFSSQAGGSYYMNHCQNCGSKPGDFYMHSEPKGAFQPITSEAARTIKLYWFNELFEAAVGTYSIDIDYFEQMQIISK